jgi:hypothetical protein
MQSRRLGGAREAAGTALRRPPSRFRSIGQQAHHRSIFAPTAPSAWYRLTIASRRASCARYNASSAWNNVTSRI